MRTDIDDSRKRGIEKNGIGIRIIGIAHFSFIVGSRVSNCLLLRIVLNVMVTTETIGQIGDFDPIVEVCLLMSRSEVERQCMIGWGAGLTCMNC